MTGISNPKVSVVVPFFNSISYVLNAITYLKKQTFSSFEVILVNDGSSVPLDEVEASIANDSRFRMISQCHLGAGEARNLGIEFARGMYVIFLDSDDIYHKCLLEKLYRSALKRDSDIVLCDANSEADLLFSILHVEHFGKDWADAQEIQSELFQLTSPVPWNKLIKLSLISSYKLKFLPLQNSNDITFTYSALAVADRISWVNEPLVKYGRSNPDSLQRLKDKNPTNLIFALEKLLYNLKTTGKFSELQNSFFKMVSENIIWNLKTFRFTESRKQLLNSFIDSTLYDAILVHEGLEREEGLRKFCKEMEWLRSNFYKEKEIPTIVGRSSEKRKFSVIIPFANDEKSISIPLQSLKSQIFRDFRVILVSNGSRDNTKEVIFKIIEGDQRFQVFEPGCLCKANAQNFGLTKANSEYILFLDPCDALTPDSLYQLNQNIEHLKPDVILFEAARVNSNSLKCKSFINRCDELDNGYGRNENDSGLLSGPEVMVKAYNSREFIASAIRPAVKKKFLEEYKIKFIPSSLHEDYSYLFEILLTSKRVMVLKEKLYLKSAVLECRGNNEGSVSEVWSYYMSFQRTQELLRSSDVCALLTEEQAFAFQNISFGLLKSAQKIWKNIPYPSIFLSFIPKDQRFIFEKLIGSSKITDTNLNLSEKEIKLVKLKRKYIDYLRYILRKLGVN